MGKCSGMRGGVFKESQVGSEGKVVGKAGRSVGLVGGLIGRRVRRGALQPSRAALCDEDPCQLPAHPAVSGAAGSRMCQCFWPALIRLALEASLTMPECHVLLHICPRDKEDNGMGIGKRSAGKWSSMPTCRQLAARTAARAMIRRNKKGRPRIGRSIATV